MDDKLNSPYSKEIIQSNYNIAIIQNLVLKKAHKHQLKIDQVDKLVTRAAHAVLKDMTPYMLGTKQINDRQCKQIQDVFEKLREKMNANALQKEIKSQEQSSKMASMLNRLRNRQIDLSNPNQKTKLLEDYYQIMGCEVSYSNWQEGAVILGPNPQLPNYRVHEVIKNKHGLQMIVLTPDLPLSESNKDFPPIFCCRGTTSNLHNIIDDMNKHIGQYSFEKSDNQILQTLTEVTKKYGSAVVTGHSLGGAIAQVMTAKFCGLTNPSSEQPLIKSTYHFSAPGVGQVIASEYKNKLKNLPKERQPHVASYYHTGDVVVMAGGEHLEPNTRTELGNISFGDFLSPLALIKKAHSWSALISEFSHKRVVNTLSPLRKINRSISEATRQTFSGIFRKAVIDRIQTKQKSKIEARKLIAFMKTQSYQRFNQIKDSLQNKYLDEMSEKNGKDQGIELTEFY